MRLYLLFGCLLALHIPQLAQAQTAKMLTRMARENYSQGKWHTALGYYHRACAQRKNYQPSKDGYMQCGNAMLSQYLAKGNEALTVNDLRTYVQQLAECRKMVQTAAKVRVRLLADTSMYAVLRQQADAYAMRCLDTALLALDSQRYFAAVAATMLDTNLHCSARVLRHADSIRKACAARKQVVVSIATHHTSGDAATLLSGITVQVQQQLGSAHPLIHILDSDAQKFVLAAQKLADVSTNIANEDLQVNVTGANYLVACRITDYVEEESSINREAKTAYRGRSYTYTHKGKTYNASAYDIPVTYYKCIGHKLVQYSLDYKLYNVLDGKLIHSQPISQQFREDIEFYELYDASPSDLSMVSVPEVSSPTAQLIYSTLGLMSSALGQKRIFRKKETPYTATYSIRQQLLPLLSQKIVEQTLHVIQQHEH